MACWARQKAQTPKTADSGACLDIAPEHATATIESRASEKLSDEVCCGAVSRDNKSQDPDWRGDFLRRCISACVLLFVRVQLIHNSPILPKQRIAGPQALELEQNLQMYFD